ncbi:hypothetical protein AB0F88_42025 [Streptosporangium sp. NPDC023963]|uniref:hypothetical protein n=1 Tax=Streptosporangium sp. NPDC023963 TaxID=3155608 RepID=UPI0034446E8F
MTSFIGTRRAGLKSVPIVYAVREAGLLRVTPEGGFRRHELRLAEMEIRFPGVLTSILQAA